MTQALLPLSQSIPLAVAAIRSAETIVMACHVNPDGDALGSMVGLALGLAPLGKTLTLLSADGVPEMYRFLPGVDLIQTTSNTESFDLAIVLDSGDLERVGSSVLPVVGRARRMIDIDHHSSGTFGDIVVLESVAASTCEIVYDVLLQLGVPLTPEIATCLFTGVITDTGSFRFQNVTPSTFRIAANLIEHGAPPAYVSERVFDNRSLAATRLLGAALNSLHYTEDERIVWATITAADFIRCGASDADTEGIVNFARGVRGADVGMLLREVGDGSVRISLRSQDTVNVANVAKEFGGGGHRMAAGCTLPPPLAQAESRIVEAVRRALDHAGGPPVTDG
ncbi:MAG: DHH family phosphoesterase [Capsulimonadaceae bacterium]